MEDFRITNQTEYLLEFVGDEVRTFPWEGTQVHQSGRVILDGQHPAHQNTKGITFSQLTKVNEIKLKSITKAL
jgi:hypothetical protein